MIYFVNPVVCDYGVFERTFTKEDKLIAICNAKDNADLVAEILNADLSHEIWKPKESEVTNDV